MSIQININNFTGPDYYIGWTPLPCSASQQPAGAAVTATVKNKDTTTGGQMVFMLNKNDPPADFITITLPADGSPAQFYIAGKYNFPSSKDKDAAFVIIDNTGTLLIEQALMVRVRKNANMMTPAERDRWIDAIWTFNQAGNYELYCNIHNDNGYPEAHGRIGFLPWHRTFLLDLERALQVTHPDVTIPYWKFDEKAPNVFSPDFMGSPGRHGRLQFSGTNPLSKWSVLGINGIVRIKSFANSVSALKNERDTMSIQSFYDPNNGGIEADPHNAAHGNFVQGPITDPTTAPQDPLFFMLHSNVDRLWALWQANNKFYDFTNIQTYPLIGNGLRHNNYPRLGDYTEDTLWPWNLDTAAPRPSVIRGIGMPQPAGYPPGSWPEKAAALKQVIDYQGINTAMPNYFDYDEIYYQS